MKKLWRGWHPCIVTIQDTLDVPHYYFARKKTWILSGFLLARPYFSHYRSRVFSDSMVHRSRRFFAELASFGLGYMKTLSSQARLKNPCFLDNYQNPCKSFFENKSVFFSGKISVSDNPNSHQTSRLGFFPTFDGEARHWRIIEYDRVRGQSQNTLTLSEK